MKIDTTSILIIIYLFVIHLQSVAQIKSSTGPRIKKINNISSFADSINDVNKNEILKAIASNMIRVEGGSFQMGSLDGDEKPIHEVKLNGFYISKYELTQKQWQAVMGKNPSRNICENCPVEQVSYEDVIGFITKLNALNSKTYRLPTEAEWEYAARGGKKSQDYVYSGSYRLDSVGWYVANADRKVHEVGLKKPNELGLYDMNGNVWEWCSDWYGKNYYSDSARENPKGPEMGEFHVLRGGSWVSKNDKCKNTNRKKSGTVVSSSARGFRLVQDVSNMH